MEAFGFKPQTPRGGQLHRSGKSSREVPRLRGSGLLAAPTAASATDPVAGLRRPRFGARVSGLAQIHEYTCFRRLLGPIEELARPAPLGQGSSSIAGKRERRA